MGIDISVKFSQKEQFEMGLNLLRPVSSFLGKI